MSEKPPITPLNNDPVVKEMAPEENPNPFSALGIGKDGKVKLATEPVANSRGLPAKPSTEKEKAKKHMEELILANLPPESTVVDAVPVAKEVSKKPKPPVPPARQKPPQPTTLPNTLADLDGGVPLLSSIATPETTSDGKSIITIENLHSIFNGISSAKELENFITDHGGYEKLTIIELDGQGRENILTQDQVKKILEDRMRYLQNSDAVLVRKKLEQEAKLRSMGVPPGKNPPKIVKKAPPAKSSIVPTETPTTTQGSHNQEKKTLTLRRALGESRSETDKNSNETDPQPDGRQKISKKALARMAESAGRSMNLAPADEGDKYGTKNKTLKRLQEQKPGATSDLQTATPDNLAREGVSPDSKDNTTEPYVFPDLAKVDSAFPDLRYYKPQKKTPDAPKELSREEQIETCTTIPQLTAYLSSLGAIKETKNPGAILGKYLAEKISAINPENLEGLEDITEAYGIREKVRKLIMARSGKDKKNESSEQPTSTGGGNHYHIDQPSNPEKPGMVTRVWKRLKSIFNAILNRNSEKY